MSKLKILIVVTLTLSAIVFLPGNAEARCYSDSGYYRGCGQWGPWGWGPWGPGVGWGQGNPYFHGPRCGWVRIRAWHNGHRTFGRAWRCR
jgi:hypothetical protein